MKSISQQFEEILTDLQIEMQKEVDKYTKKVIKKGNKGMRFLDNQTEELLKECIDQESTFPEVLQDKFIKAKDNPLEKTRLCRKIRVLIDEGYISELEWADDVPYLGQIEQKGMNYFKEKEIYVRAMLKKDPDFHLLDGECETILQKIIDMNNSEHFIINNSFCSLQVINELIDNGYLKTTVKGFSYITTGGFSVVVILTQKGKNYFKDKEQKIEEILLYGENILNITNIGKQEIISGPKRVGFENCTNLTNCKAIGVENDFKESQIVNSPIQIGNTDSNQNNEYYFQQSQEVLDEIKSKIDDLKLSMEKREELENNIKIAEQLLKDKNKFGLKNVIKSIGSIIKDFGISLVSGILLLKIQGLI